ISGYTMMLVPPGEYPMVAPSSSFLVAPGNGYSVALEMEESAASEELHGNECVPGSPDVLYRDHLTGEYLGSLAGGIFLRPLEFHYNHLTCFHRHKHELFINAFGCQPSGYPLFWEHRAWPRCLNLSEASSAVLTRLRSASLEETTQIDKQASASCSKRIPCHSRSYRAVFSFGRWPGVGSSTIGYFAKEHQAVSEAEAPARWRLTRMARQLLQPGGHSAHLESLFRSYVAESHLRVSVWGSSARSPLVVLSASYSWTAFLADTGGLLGLYIGCSLLTLCELLDLFYMLLEGRLLCATKKCKRRNGQDSAAADEGREPTSAVASAAQPRTNNQLLMLTARPPLRLLLLTSRETLTDRITVLPRRTDMVRSAMSARCSASSICCWALRLGDGFLRLALEFTSGSHAVLGAALLLVQLGLEIAHPALQLLNHPAALSGGKGFSLLQLHGIINTTYLKLFAKRLGIFVVLLLHPQLISQPLSLSGQPVGPVGLGQTSRLRLLRLRLSAREFRLQAALVPGQALQLRSQVVQPAAGLAQLSLSRLGLALHGLQRRAHLLQLALGSGASLLGGADSSLCRLVRPTLFLQEYLQLVCSRLQRLDLLGQISISPVQVVHLGFQIGSQRFVLLARPADLALVLGLDFRDGHVQLFNGPLAGLADVLELCFAVAQTGLQLGLQGCQSLSRLLVFELKLAQSLLGILQRGRQRISLSLQLVTLRRRLRSRLLLLASFSCEVSWAFSRSSWLRRSSEVCKSLRIRASSDCSSCSSVSFCLVFSKLLARLRSRSDMSSSSVMRMVNFLRISSYSSILTTMSRSYLVFEAAKSALSLDSWVKIVLLQRNQLALDVGARLKSDWLAMSSISTSIEVLSFSARALCLLAFSSSLVSSVIIKVYFFFTLHRFLIPSAHQFLGLRADAAGLLKALVRRLKLVGVVVHVALRLTLRPANDDDPEASVRELLDMTPPELIVTSVVVLAMGTSSGRNSGDECTNRRKNRAIATLLTRPRTLAKAVQRPIVAARQQRTCLILSAQAAMVYSPAKAMAMPLGLQMQARENGTVPGYATTMITPDTPKKDRVPDPYRYAMDRRQSDKPRIQLIQQRHDPPGAGRQKGELYHPQVEAISPAPEDARNEQKLQKEKNDVGQKLINIESEIKSTVDQLAAKTSELEKLQLKARQGETEEGRRREEEELAQRLVNPFAAVLADNRRKARDSHRQIAETAGRGLLDRPDRGGPDSFFRVLPLYNQPSDVPAIRDQELRHQEFKPRLIHHIRRLVLANAHRERHLRENYDQLQRQWTRRLERLGNSAKRKQRDAKSRDYFEKYFPEVRKSREEKERMERFYAQPAARSEAEVNEMVDTIKNAREEEERMKSLAVLPPMLLPPWERRRLVANSNGLVRGDPVQLWNADQDLSFRWLPHERATFKEKFLLYGKNFGAIAAFLENKSVPDCVQFYYLTKKKEAYKQLYKKHNIRRRKVIEANRTGGGASSAAPAAAAPASAANPTVAVSNADGTNSEPSVPPQSSQQESPPSSTPPLPPPPPQQQQQQQQQPQQQAKQTPHSTPPHRSPLRPPSASRQSSSPLAPTATLNPPSAAAAAAASSSPGGNSSLGGRLTALSPMPAASMGASVAEESPQKSIKDLINITIEKNLTTVSGPPPPASQQLPASLIVSRPYPVQQPSQPASVVRNSSSSPKMPMNRFDYSASAAQQQAAAAADMMRHRQKQQQQPPPPLLMSQSDYFAAQAEQKYREEVEPFTFRGRAMSDAERTRTSSEASQLYHVLANRRQPAAASDSPASGQSNASANSNSAAAAAVDGSNGISAGAASAASSAPPKPNSTGETAPSAKNSGGGSEASSPGDLQIDLEEAAAAEANIVGVTVLAMPFCFAQCGFLLAGLLLILVSLATLKSSRMLLTCALATKQNSFEFLAHYLYGPMGKLIVEFSMIGLSLGTLVAFQIIVGDLCPQVVAALLGSDPASLPNLRGVVMTAFAAGVILPLSLMRDPASLARISFVSLSCYAGFLLHLIGLTLQQKISELLNPALKNPYEAPYNWFRPSGLFYALPIMCLAFSCQTQLFLLYDSLSQPSIKTVQKILTLSVGAIGYVACNASHPVIHGDLTAMYPSTPLCNLVRLFLVMSIAVSFPVIIYPCRVSVFSLFYLRQTGLSDTPSGGLGDIIGGQVSVGGVIPETQFRGITVAIVVGTLAGGLLLPNVEFVLGITGALTGSVICYILPASFSLTVFKSSGRTAAAAILAVGLLALSVSTLAVLTKQSENFAANVPAVGGAGHGHPRLQPPPMDMPERQVKAEMPPLAKHNWKRAVNTDRSNDVIKTLKNWLDQSQEPSSVERRQRRPLQRRAAQDEAGQHRPGQQEVRHGQAEQAGHRQRTHRIPAEPAGHLALHVRLPGGGGRRSGDGAALIGGKGEPLDADKQRAEPAAAEVPEASAAEVVADDVQPGAEAGGLLQAASGPAVHQVWHI
uniref:SANT domain-containing protein n=1 Tax=Macrostomum lignano TaxID=282301 RepID=A0A1I8HBC4_9PLAT